MERIEVLLDTHALLWLLDGGGDLGPKARDAIATDVDPCFSSMSVAEIRIKEMLGKLRVPTDLLARIERSGLRELPLSSAAADRLMGWPSLVRHDPFDRLLLAQAVAAESMLVTADRVLLGLDGAPVIDARA